MTSRRAAARCGITTGAPGLEGAETEAPGTGSAGGDGVTGGGRGGPARVAAGGGKGGACFSPQPIPQSTRPSPGRVSRTRPRGPRHVPTAVQG